MGGNEGTISVKSNVDPYKTTNKINISSLCYLKVFINPEIKYKYDIGDQNNSIHTLM